MAIPIAKKKKKTYSQLEWENMCSLHRKELAKAKMETIELVETMYKTTLYTYLVDVKKFKQKDLEAVDLQFGKAMLAMGGKTLTLEDLAASLQKNGIDIEAINKKTDDFITKYREQWG